MARSIIFIPFIIICVALTVAVPIMIGTYVYKDAKQRGLNAPLWTLVALLAPGFIGLIIYLIIRQEKAPLKCPACGFPVRENFSVCPQCGASLKNKCTSCGYPIESGWKNCPNCAAPIAQDSYYNTVSPIEAEPKDNSLKKILIAVIVIPLILCVLVVAGSLAIYMVDSVVAYAPDSYSSEFHTDLKKSDFESPEIQKWFADCDNMGKGAYVLSEYKHNENGNYTSSFLVYINDKERTAQDDISQRRKHLTACINLFEKEEDIEKDYTLMYYTGESASYSMELELTEFEDEFDDSVALDYNEISASDIGAESFEALLPYEVLNNDEITVEVFVHDIVKNIALVSLTFYIEGKAVHTQAVQNADGSTFVGNASFVMNADENKFDEFSFSLVDMNGKTVLESEIYKLDGHSNYEFKIGLKDHVSHEPVILQDSYNSPSRLLTD